MKLVVIQTLKRLNSTRRHDFADPFELTFTNIKFRVPTSLHRPSFIVRIPNAPSNWLEGYNYAGFFENDASEIPTMYLWIDDIVYNVDGTWTIDTHVDVLAQYKVPILDSSLFVLRNANTYNALLADTASPTVLDDESDTVNITTPIFAYNFNDGSYVVGLMNDDVAAVGVPHYYVMTQAEWTTFTSNLLNTADWLNINPSEISANLQKALVNPMQYIVSAQWIPVPVATMEQKLSAIPLGFWTIPNSPCGRWSGAFTTKEFSVTLPIHPQSASLAYLNYAPYATYRLTIAPFGTIEMPSWVEGGNVLKGFIYVDPSTGDAILRLTVNDDVIGTYNAKVGVDLPIGQVITDVSKVSIGDAAQSAISAISGLDNFFAVGAVESVASGVVSGLAASTTAVQTRGSKGSIAAYIDVPRVTAVFKKIAATNYAGLMGRPLCRVVQLKDLTGFTMCANGNVQCEATPEEKSQIGMFLTTGFFIE